MAATAFLCHRQLPILQSDSFSAPIKNPSTFLGRTAGSGARNAEGLCIKSTVKGCSTPVLNTLVPIAC